MNVVGKVLHQILADHLAVGADILQATAAVQEQYALGQQRMLHAKAGLQTAQVPAIGDYPHEMK